jgi:hypothetical protein
MIFAIYLIIGFLLDLHIENIINNTPRDIMEIIAKEYDVDIYNPKIRFIVLLICLFGWPFLLINMFNNK